MQNSSTNGALESTAAAWDSRMDVALEFAAVTRIIESAGADCSIVLPDRTQSSYGLGEPRFTVEFHSVRALRRGFDQLALGTAYINGEIDVEGDMMALMELRDHLPSGSAPLHLLKFAWDLVVAAPAGVNKRAIDAHYTLGDDFYHMFLDKRFRFYSQCLFQRDDETLEEAAEHKLETMWNELGLRAGMSLLDIGGGWGGVARYCAPRGVHVTTITLAEDSATYMRKTFAEEGIDAQVVHADLLHFRPEVHFDHAVMYGVIEHLPNYRRFSQRAWELLAPGGRLYLDGSATKEKFAMTAFTRKYIWPGHHTFMSLPDITRELLWHGFEFVDAKQETRDYELTMLHWAQRFDEARGEIISRWGEAVYRTFRLYLWAGAHAFRTDRLQAYHLTVQKRSDPGPRPGGLRRAASAAIALLS
ncbi:class I SAM-dependent methyltransferase [Nocardia brasiliensis]|uniref:class I SAM-dependent methyltransferase n=1 Tax=Nocardia brasiliensis TaxID=37326 RepID=UPI002455A169|nr:class I SAM-dependent methyltransferase [Nocardia brasiliensis]